MNHIIENVVLCQYEHMQGVWFNFMYWCLENQDSSFSPKMEIASLSIFLTYSLSQVE